MKKRLTTHITLGTSFGSGLLALPGRAFAVATSANCAQSIGGFLDFPTWYKYLSPTITNGECVLSFDIKNDLPKVLLAVFEIIMRVGGLVAVGFVIFGGFKLILSQGNPDQTKGARSTIINALIGLAISIASVAIVNLIGKNI